MIAITENDFTRINHDVNGNPRYVIHFLQLNTQQELDAPMWDKDGRGLMTIDKKYMLAVKRANRIGGRKYHNKSYGGGIVFQSYSIRELIRDIERVVQEDEKKQAQEAGDYSNPSVMHQTFNESTDDWHD